MALRAILFDLFDTLVDVHMDQLPRVEVAGRRFPSTLGALYLAAQAWTDAPFDEFALALLASDADLHKSHYALGRELPTRLRFEVFCRGFAIEAPEAPDVLTRTHMAGVRGQVRALAHHPALLDHLRGRFALGVVSNFSHTPTALDVLRDAKLLAHLDPVVVSEDVGVRKPRPEIFQAALARLGLAPEEVVHVGDDLQADVAGAADLGLRTVWVTRRKADPDALLAAHTGARPTHRLADLADLPAWLETQR